VRQVKRLCKAYQASGAAGLISKRRRQPSNNRLPETIDQARQLLRARYHDFGPTLATEKLAIEGVSLSDRPSVADRRRALESQSCASPSDSSVT